MFSSIRSFWRDENGAVTVDWVVLTAGTVSFALGVSSLAFGSPDHSSETLSETVAAEPSND